MIKNINEIIHKKNHNKEDINFYAQIIKNERTRRNMTLEEMSENICCVSYLSKFENSLVKASDRYIKALFEKININYEDLKLRVSEDTTKEVVEAYFYENYGKIDDIYNLVITTPFSSTRQFVTLFHLLAKGEFVNFEEELRLIDNIKATLNDYEKLIYLLIMIEYNIQNYYFKDAKTLLEYTKFINVDDKIISYLLLEAQMRTYYELHNYLRFYQSYQKFQSIDSIAYPIEKKIYFRLIHNDLLSSEFIDQVLDDVKTCDLSILSGKKRIDSIYILYLIRMKKGNLKDIFEEIIANDYFYDIRFLALLAIICYRVNDSMITNKFLQMVENYAFQKSGFIHQRFVCFVSLYKTSFEKMEVITFIKNEIIPYIKKETNYYYDNIYKDVYVEYLAKESRYKESYKFLSEFYK